MDPILLCRRRQHAQLPGALQPRCRAVRDGTAIAPSHSHQTSLVAPPPGSPRTKWVAAGAKTPWLLSLSAAHTCLRPQEQQGSVASDK